MEVGVFVSALSILKVEYGNNFPSHRDIKQNLLRLDHVLRDQERCLKPITYFR